MRKLILEAFVAWLALAAVSGQACAARHTDINSDSAMNSQGRELAVNGGIRSNTRARRDGERMELKRQAIFNPQEGGVSRVVLAANRDSGQVKEIRIVRIDDSQAVKFNPATNAQLVSRPTFPVPEPGSWATALAGLLGVIAIARRRMSL